MKKGAIILVFILSVFQLGAQSYTNKSILQFQNNQLDEAMVYADSAIHHATESKDAYTWYVHGMLYKEVYKQREAGNILSSKREVAIESFKKSLLLGADEKSRTSIELALKYLAASYYNDAVKSMDTVNYEKTEPAYLKYKVTMRLINPDADFKTADKEFYLALATQIGRKFDSRKEALTMVYMENAVNIYEKVLEIDSLDCNAHYNIGQMYYNLGVKTIMSLKEDAPLEEIVAAQEKCLYLFHKSLPHLKKTLSLDNCRTSRHLLNDVIIEIQYQINPDQNPFPDTWKKK